MHTLCTKPWTTFIVRYILHTEPIPWDRDNYRAFEQLGPGVNVRCFELVLVHEQNLTALRTVPIIVIAHTFCASRDTRISYR